MFKTSVQAMVAAKRLAPSMPCGVGEQYGLKAAQSLIAEVLELGDWPTTIEVLDSGRATYCSAWRELAASRWCEDREIHHVGPRPLPEFSEVFPPQCEVAIEEVQGFSLRDAMRVVAKASSPYDLDPDVLDIAGHRDGKLWMVESAAIGDLSVEFVAFKNNGPSRLANFSWRILARRHGNQVGHCYGEMYVPARGRPMRVWDAIAEADEYSDLDVSNVKAICEVMGNLSGGVATLGMLYLCPVARGNGYGREMLFQAMGWLKKASRHFNCLALDPALASTMNRFPAGFRLGGAATLDGDKAVQLCFVDHYLRPVRDWMAGKKIRLLLAPMQQQLGRRQVVCLLNSEASGVDPSELLLPEEDDLSDR